MALQWPSTQVQTSSLTLKGIPPEREPMVIEPPAEVLDFCLAHQLSHGFQQAVELIQQHFSRLSEIVPRMQSEPETGETWIVIDAVVSSTSVAELHAEYNSLVEAWVQVSETRVLDHITITTSFA